MKDWLCDEIAADNTKEEDKEFKLKITFLTWLTYTIILVYFTVSISYKIRI